MIIRYNLSIIYLFGLPILQCVYRKFTANVTFLYILTPVGVGLLRAEPWVAHVAPNGLPKADVREDPDK